MNFENRQLKGFFN